MWYLFRNIGVLTPFFDVRSQSKAGDARVLVAPDLDLPGLLAQDRHGHLMGTRDEWVSSLSIRYSTILAKKLLVVIHKDSVDLKDYWG